MSRATEAQAEWANISTEEYAQRCFDLRGYLVVGGMQPLEIGSMQTLDDQPGTATDAKAVVIAKTNRADMELQLKAMGEGWRIPQINCIYFHRMVAE